MFWKSENETSYKVSLVDGAEPEFNIFGVAVKLGVSIGYQVGTGVIHAQLDPDQIEAFRIEGYELTAEK